MAHSPQIIRQTLKEHLCDTGALVTSKLSCKEGWEHREKRRSLKPELAKLMVSEGAVLEPSLTLRMADFAHAAWGKVFKSDTPKPSDRPWVAAGIDKPPSV